MSELALPKPETVTLTEVRGKLLPLSAELRLEIAERRDIPLARECCRQLEAYRKYLQDREGRDLLAAECRRMEVLIGKLLGPGEQGGDRRSGDFKLPVSDLNDVPKDDRHKFRVMAAHEATVESLLAEGKVSRNVILDKIKRLQTPAVIDSGCTPDDLHALAASGRKFGCVYADPPWRYDNQATRAATGGHYAPQEGENDEAGMTVEQICALPVAALAADDAHLHLWTTNAFLFDAPRIFAAWGFEFRSSFVWVKPQMGIGNYWRNSHEFLLTAIRGDAKRFNDHSMKSWIEAKRGRHSAKPEHVRLMIERASRGPYLELFGRMAVNGWAVWGNEVSRDMYTQSLPMEEAS